MKWPEAPSHEACLAASRARYIAYDLIDEPRKPCESLDGKPFAAQLEVLTEAIRAAGQRYSNLVSAVGPIRFYESVGQKMSAASEALDLEKRLRDPLHIGPATRMDAS